MDSGRIHRIIYDVIARIQLNLTGKVLLTELGSDNFLFTPLIGALANAKKVIAWTKDTHFGKGDDLVDLCKNLMNKFKIPETTIVFRVNERPNEDIKQADIITNLGMLRPLNADFINSISKDAVISYMCEAWELRESDVDINSCKQNGIRVIGTWENHPLLKIFDACGHLSAKLALEAGFEIYQNKICIISPDHFGEVAYNIFKSLNANVIDKISPANLETIDLNNYDFIFLADYSTAIEYVGTNGVLNYSPAPIVHLSGRIDEFYAAKNNIKIYPMQTGYSKKMTRTLAYLGPKPVIDLHAAGLKVAQDALNNEECEFAQKIV